MHAILLCAGLGSRLLPLTADRPKCLIEAGGRTILDHQVEALRSAGVRAITVVGGYRFDRLQDYVTDRWTASDRPELVYNPFFAISGSIGSVWAARDRLRGPFCILNGDTVYDPALVSDGLARAEGTHGIGLFVEPIVVPVLDDMLVHMRGDAVAGVGKGLDRATHRSLGFVTSAGPGAAADGSAYAEALAHVIAQVDGSQAFHHAVVARLAGQGRVCGIPFTGGVWTEIDRPVDLAQWKPTRAPVEPRAFPSHQLQRVAAR